MNTLTLRRNKRMEVVEKVIFPLLLLAYPLLLINQGIDITDTTYSLGYYRFMDEMDNTWVLATYLANVAGAFLMKLPMGDTLLGMNLYTGILAGTIALAGYFGMKRWMSSAAAFTGEVIALSLCWCPTTTLYNYLTYLLFAAGCLLLYRGLAEGRNKGYILAGICLGLNVMVRFSNLAEAGLILAVWYAGWLNREKAAEVIRKTALCAAGYAAGIGSILAVIAVKYGIGSFGAMISGLFGMTGEASDYTLLGMIQATGSAYAAALKWMVYMVPCVFAGMIMFYIKKGRFERVKKGLYCLGIVILLRFYLGQGMFSLRYYNEGSIFQWMMLFLILSVICCAVQIGGFLSGGNREKILAAVVLLIIVLTPLGSNNYTYQNMNNLFLVAPHTLWICYQIWLRTKEKSHHFPWQAFGAVIVLMTLVQGVLFGCNYVFRDGIYGERRDTKVENSRVLRGMYTTKENAESLTGLIAFCEENNRTKEPFLFWGDAPGLSYILDIPPAIFTTWPEIPSNTYASLERALEELEGEPPVILHNDTGKPVTEGEKTDLILDYIKAHHYELLYENKNYRIYGPERMQSE